MGAFVKQVKIKIKKKVFKNKKKLSPIQ